MEPLTSTGLPDLGSRFAVLRELGRGGMATVYLAHDNTLDREVAIKLLSGDLSASLGAERFTREIHVTARLVHPGIVPLYDSGRAGESLFYVMPFIDAPTLWETIRTGGPLPEETVLRIAQDVGEALVYAHGKGCVHRDLKPENIFLSDGRALLADFGIARLVSSSNATATRLTQVGHVLGTAAYMSPEQVTDGESVDPRADLYSLGCVLFELLTGETPYRGSNPMAMMAQHLTAPLPRVVDRRAGTDPAFAALIEQLLAKDPADRPASASAFLSLLRGLHSAEHPAPVVTAPTAATPSAARVASDAACDEGRSYFSKSFQGGEGTKSKLELALSLFERSKSLDPTNPRPYSGLADTYWVLGIRGFRDADESRRTASEYRQQALAIQPDFPELHTSLGAIFLWWDDDFESGGRELAKGAGPTAVTPEGPRLYSCWLKMAGRMDEAIVVAEQAITMDPKAPVCRIGIGDILMAMGHNDEAILSLREALRLNPQYEPALERLELACHRAGRIDEAIDARRMLHGIRGKQERLAALDADLAAMSPDEARIRDLQRDLQDLLTRAATSNAFEDLAGTRQLSDLIIITLTELGEWSRAMDWVESGYFRRPGRLRRVLTDFPYDRRGLAVDPRYARLLRTAGLEELLR